jgi:Mat/Ecp fimbriae periplasmic chaperone
VTKDIAAKSRAGALIGLALAGFVFGIPAARAEIALSQVIVDFEPNAATHQDIEVWNPGATRTFVVVEPYEIKNAGLPQEQRTSAPDPATLGLLVSPQRIILEPGQRRLVRVSAVTPRQQSDRIYRLTIKEVAGDVSAESSALMLLLGYDVLVMLRPEVIAGTVVARREGNRLVLRNESNTAQEIFEGQQCNAKGDECLSLAGTRLYPGAELAMDLEYDTGGQFQVRYGQVVRELRF